MIDLSSDDEGLGILEEPEAPQQPPKLEKPGEDDEQTEMELPEDERPKIFTIKTQVGQERNVADLLYGKVRKMKENTPIVSILAPQELRGYVFIEAFDETLVKDIIKPISYARSMLEGDVPFTQVEHFLTPVSAVAKIAEGDIVELVAGPFRGEKAKVTRIDDAKEEITVELFEALVPIPITVRGENVRVLKRKDD